MEDFLTLFRDSMLTLIECIDYFMHQPFTFFPLVTWGQFVLGMLILYVIWKLIFEVLIIN